MASKPLLSVVIPVYNEENCIVETVRRVGAYCEFAGIPGEILVSNDGSTDGTAARLRAASPGPMASLKVLTSEKNTGKGYAARQGVLQATGDTILLTDADLSTPMKEVEKLQESLAGGADVAIGSRARRVKGADVQQSFKRYVSGRIFNGIVQALILPGVHDTQCGFKLFKAQVARTLFSKQQLPGFSFDVEILYLARRAGLRIAEVPVMWRQGESSHVKLFRDSTRMVRDLAVIKKIHGGDPA